MSRSAVLIFKIQNNWNLSKGWICKRLEPDIKKPCNRFDYKVFIFSAQNKGIYDDAVEKLGDHILHRDRFGVENTVCLKQIFSAVRH